MSTQPNQSAQAYWDFTAETYDQIFPNTVIGQAQRDVVWGELTRVFHSGQRVLELNCGTGIDAVHLAQSGVTLLACDISPRMIELACRRSSTTQVGGLIDFRVLATEDIAALVDERPFDGAFSNFAGLNCVEDLSAVARNLARLLKPGAQLLVCLMGRFFLWEAAWYLVHGNPRKGLRRFTCGSAGSLNDHAMVRVYCRSVGTVAQIFAPEFRLRHWRGVGVTIPPSPLEGWAGRFPRLLKWLTRTDRWIGQIPIFRSMADCVLLQFEYAEGRSD
jgi:ubiquinone/menaquinone biosynthesis C-methylase UbiE